jgi:hypothetical protein
MVASRFPDAPPQIAALATESRGFPIPWFVPIYDGKPEFRAVDPHKVFETHRKRLCWICGQKLGSKMVFVIGPMCGVNRVTSEPPSHLACALFAVKACPFISKPLAKRADLGDLPHQDAPGIMIERNPGVTLVWPTQSYRAVRQPEGGLLFFIGSPGAVSWWREGRHATTAEIMESIETGLPALASVARQEGPEAVIELKRLVERAVKLVPVE